MSIFITPHKTRVLYYWEVAANTKLFKDSSLGNAVFIFEGIGHKIRVFVHYSIWTKKWIKMKVR